jgi:hypothetical protein
MFAGREQRRMVMPALGRSSDWRLEVPSSRRRDMLGVESAFDHLRSLAVPVGPMTGVRRPMSFARPALTDRTQSEAVIQRRCIWPGRIHRRSSSVMAASDPPSAIGTTCRRRGAAVLHYSTWRAAVNVDKALLSGAGL